MGGCYKIFKIGVIILTLVQFGIGYAKVYQLFSDIGSTFQDGGASVDSFSDLAWLPYLFIQIFTTVFIILQVYFLCRELCYDNFMYDFCFRCCFVLTTLNFLLVIFPKTIINIIYQRADISIEEWWAQIVDSLDSLIANISNLGFQIILYMRILKKFLKFLKCCQQKVSPMMVKAVDKTKALRNKGAVKGTANNNEVKLETVPENAELDGETAVNENTDSNVNNNNNNATHSTDDLITPGCCLFVPMTKSKHQTSTQDSDDAQKASNDEQPAKKEGPARKVLAKKEALKAKMNKTVDTHVGKVTGRVDKYSSRMKTSLSNTSNKAKQKVGTRLIIPVDSEDVCKCENPVVSTSNLEVGATGVSHLPSSSGNVMSVTEITADEGTDNIPAASSYSSEGTGQDTTKDITVSGDDAKVTFSDDATESKTSDEAEVRKDSFDKPGDTKEGDLKETSEVDTKAKVGGNTKRDKRMHCETCGKVVPDLNDKQNRFSQCYNSKRMMKCRTLCGLLDNRPLCMKITLTMSCVHFFVYIIELVFVFI